jgi:hypothetical protein
MTLIVARLLISLALLCAPFALFAIGTRSAGGLIWFMFPVVYGTPALLGALLFFAPLEGFLNARGLGHLKNVAVPLAGAVLIVLFTFLFLKATGGLSKALARVSSGGPAAVGALALWSAVGAVWGAVWRLSDWIAARAGLGGPA